MQLVISNLTGSTKTYLSGAVTVLANSTTSVTDATQQLSLMTDGALRLDIVSGNVNITDGTNIFSNTEAINYLLNLSKVIVPTTDGSGNLITSTVASSKRGLDVNISGSDSTIYINSVLVDGNKTTYSASTIGTSLTTLATDLLTITGSATKTIRVTASSLTFTGGGLVVSAQLVKRSTANSGGTSTTLTAVPHDSNNASATATVRAYTANPTLGTLVGPIRAIRASSSLLLSSTNPGTIEYFFGDRPAQAIVLRGTSQVLAWNFNGVTLTGGVFAGYFEWTEE